MGKCKELSILLDELETQAKDILESVSRIRNMFTSTPEPEENPSVYDDGYGYEETEIYVKKPITLEEVRKELAEISRDGKTAEVRELLKKYGAKKLSEVNPDNYQALLDEAEVLKNGK